MLHPAVMAPAGITEVMERTALAKVFQIGAPFRRIGGLAGQFLPRFAQAKFHGHAGDFLDPGREIGELQIPVHFPEPVGRRFGEIAELQLAIPKFGLQGL